MKKILVILFFVLFLLSARISVSYAASTASAQYLKKINSVRAYFGGLKGVSKISYTLMYNGNGIGQGVMGSFTPGKKTSASKDFFLGTCSSRVCIIHKNIKNIQLEVVTKYTNGKSSTRTVNVKS